MHGYEFKAGIPDSGRLFSGFGQYTKRNAKENLGKEMHQLPERTHQIVAK
jgi:hypothetical protein